jgi:hypothetical protein
MSERGYWRGTQRDAKSCPMGKISFTQTRYRGSFLLRPSSRTQLGQSGTGVIFQVVHKVSSQAQTIGSVTLLNHNNRAALLLLACSSVDYHIDSGKRRTDASLLSPVFQTLPHHVVTLNL